MRGLLFCGAVLALLSGCAVAPEKISGPDGSDAYFLKCGAGMNATKKCMSAATEVCPGGYSVIDRSSQIVPTQWGPASVLTMTVSCR